MKGDKVIAVLSISVIRFAKNPLNRCQEVGDWLQKLLIDSVNKSNLKDRFLIFPYLLITTNDIIISKELVDIQPRFAQLYRAKLSGGENGLNHKRNIFSQYCSSLR